MLWQRVRFALLAGVCLAGTAVSVRADDAAPASKEGCTGGPAGAAAAAPAAPTCKVQVTEWVAEPYKTTRTCYRMEQRQENYTAYRCETVPEQRQVTRTTCKMVPEVQNVTRCYYVCTPCVEERTVMQAHWTCKPVTTVVRKCVDMGHYECREVPAKPTLCERIKKLCGKDCCEPCPRTEIKKVWVPCPTWVEKPVTKMERVCEYRPVVCKVTTYKKELRQETCQVTVCKAVPECKTETVTVMVQKTVPYPATRTVCVSVPYQEEVTLTRMVARVVEREVPADATGGAAYAAGHAAGCGAPCCPPPCCTTCCKPARRCCR